MGEKAEAVVHAGAPVRRRRVNPMWYVVVTVAAFFMAGVVAINIYLPLSMEAAALETAEHENEEAAALIKLIRRYYLENVVSRARDGAVLTPGADYKENHAKIPLPVNFVRDIGDLTKGNQTSFSLVSPYSWSKEPARPMDAFEQGAWDRFQQDPNAVVSSKGIIDGKRVMRVAVADRMTAQGCVDCHNSDPSSPKRDWKLGDVRAILQVSRVIDNHMEAWEKRGAYIRAAIGVATLTSVALLLFFMMLVDWRTREKRRADDNAYFLAEHDVLTGLRNRAALCARIDAVRSDPEKAAPLSLFLFDLDRFKPVNDTYGHGTGDKLLIEVARRLKANAGPHDVLARLGGDEFALARFAPTEAEDDIAFAQSLCDAITEQYHIDGDTFTVGVSIGIARAPDDAQNTTDLLIAADLALYSVKANGRGGCKLFEPDMTIAALKRRHLEADLRAALNNNEFWIAYQPIGSIRTGRVTKFEALIRWRHPERGDVRPGDFVPLAEETGLIVAIGTWVIRQACAEIARFDNGVKVAVNLSPAQIEHESLLDVIRDAIATTGIHPSRLEVEITESIMMRNDGKTLQLLHDLRAMGVEIAMDDFGTGYSCLSYLQTFPVNCIKIDKSFVSTLGRADSSRPIITAIIVLAHALGLHTVAEGVETKEQLIELAQMGCDEVQGFYFGLPKPIDEIHVHLKDMAA